MRNEESLPKYLVEMAGIYWTAAELCKQGMVPSIPPRNVPRFDIPVTNLTGSIHATIQVKTRTDKQGWMLKWYKEGFTLDARRNHFYVFVDMSESKNVRALVMPSVSVKKIALPKARMWAKKKTRKGTPRKSFPVSINPRRGNLWRKFENRWDLLSKCRL